MSSRFHQQKQHDIRMFTADSDASQNTGVKGSSHIAPERAVV